ncbi:matrixin family metalloprotease [Halostella pelagica]|uniref:matrixin family metalloprotease n=1 Tax=Halostella pelagica TaxID=2583824 RepID=UPI001081AA1B|nr:matrixin family metalloprotease [Halostella pelagica]
MRRACLVALLVVVAGCSVGLDDVSDAADPMTGSGSPWDDDELVVAIDSGGGDREYRPLVREALSYWEGEGGQYAAYEAAFVLDPNATDPDVVVTFVDDVDECGDVDDAAGCAPRLSSDSRVDPPVAVEVEANLSDESTVIVTKHEFGHVLGLSHDDDPQSIMAHSTDLTTEPQPNATERALPWQNESLSVAVDVSNASNPSGAQDQVRHALDYYGDSADGTVPENVSFRIVENRSAADVVITYVETLPCQGDVGSCASRSGVDPDGDGAAERYDSLEITVAGVDTAAVGWHVGYWLGYGFGHTSEYDWAQPFRDADAEDRWSEWWR